MNKTFVVCILLIHTVLVEAQIENSISGSASLAETSTADGQRWAAFHNPASLGYLQKTEFGATFENRFFIKELSTKIAQAAIVTDKVNIGFGLSHFGYSVYHDLLFGAGFARNFSDRFAIGVQFNYFSSFFIEDNCYHGALLGQFGVNVRITDSFSLGFNSFNPFGTNIKTSDGIGRKLPAVFSLGSALNINDALRWRTQIDKDLNANYRFATACDYYIVKQFVVKIGVYGFEYFVPCLGAGFEIDNFAFDLNCELHPLLGLNTFAMLKYKL